MPANFSQIETKIAETEDEFRAAAQLRYDVFVDELGGDGAGVDHDLRQEHDAFDTHATQLIALDRACGDKVVGVYRLMTSEMAERAGRFYSENEYDLTAIKASGRKVLELGRSCVRSEYRGSNTMFHLWQGLGAFVADHQIEILFGVASFHGTDPQRYAQSLSNLAANYQAPDSLNARSRVYQTMALLEPSQIDKGLAVQDTPPLIKSYLRLGGVVGDGAYIDHQFNTIDVCLIMDTAKLSEKHRKLYAAGRV